MPDGRNLPKNGTGIYYWGERGGDRESERYKSSGFLLYIVYLFVRAGAVVFRFLFLTRYLFGELMGIQSCPCIIRIFGGYFIIRSGDDIYHQTAKGRVFCMNMEMLLFLS